MARTMVALSDLMVPMMFCAATRISERMEAASAVVLALTVWIVSIFAIVIMALMEPQSQPLAHARTGSRSSNAAKKNVFMMPSVLALFH